MHERTVRRKRPLETHAMNPHDKMLAAARRRARILALETSQSHQKCLDLIAIAAGRAGWSEFLRDPVPVDEKSRTTSTEPDFTAIDPSGHLLAVVEHGTALDAVSFTALPTAWDDPSPKLSYALRDRTRWGIDARGLDMNHIATACIGRDHFPDRGEEASTHVHHNLTPSVAGLPMRANAVLYGSRDMRLGAVSATLDGSIPDGIDHRLYDRPRPVSEPVTERRSVGPGLASRLMSRLKEAVRDKEEDALKRALEPRKRRLSLDVGPIVGISKGRRLRMARGCTLTCYAPPGNGRLSGIAAPVLLTDPEGSWVVHDDGQLHAITSGHRSSVGRVMTIRIDSASAHSLNPFDSHWLPSRGREKYYLDAICTALFPGDPRVARVVSMVAEELIAAEGSTTLGAIRDHIARSEEREWTRRVLTTLHPITTKAARAITDTSTVLPRHLNGTGSVEEPRPLTLYIVRDPLSDGRRHPIVAAMQAAIWSKTLNTYPGRTMKDGTVNGPCPVGCLLNDEHALPAMPTILEAMDLGRDTDSSLVILGSSRASIDRKYGRDVASAMVMMSGLRIVLPQSDPAQSLSMDPYQEVGHEKASAMDLGEAYILTGTGVPTPVRLPFYHEDDEWRGMGHSHGLGPSPARDTD
jgi:hypothetical protein